MPNAFEIKKQVLKTPEQAYAELVGGSKENQIVEIPLELIDEIDDQPQHIHEDKIERIAESMKQVGQIDPATVIPNPEAEGRYLLLAGRHRSRACQLLGKKTIKAVIKQEEDPDKQRLILLATNNDRNTDYAPSELAYSYLEQKQILERLGSKSTSSQIANDNNSNRKTVHKYIQLTNLIKPLLYKVDKGEITVGAGYELSFLTNEEQNKVFIYLTNNPSTHISKNNARIIRENPDNFNSILSPQSDKESNAITETPKAEKKINSIKTDSATCPSEGHKKAEISNEALMTTAFILYREAYSIYKYVVQQFATSEDCINFITQRYFENGIEYSGDLSDNDIGYTDFKNNHYSIEFMKNKLSVVFSSRSLGIRRFKLSYKEVDLAVRKYLRKYVNKDNIILMFGEK